ncbi:hypothetical protein [Actinoplanes flavus]|uniref:DUF3800 domain-containing protein n=1 Tax=Actinoplanes flavus TaxID=2820290 RepID=A0ABS3UD00_9ACTN|nr:hypothetical protein [Actinoplanes flavus]MBO3736642.1 hypothetical protein [Actinoplanes flavus]
MADYRLAFVDETVIERRNRTGVYLFAGVVIDGAGLPDTITAVRQATGNNSFHATDLYRRGFHSRITALLDTITEHAGWTFYVAQPIGPRDREQSRQQALVRMLHQLDEQKVHDVIADTRAGPDEQAQTQREGRKVTVADTPDIDTYKRLVRSRQISARMRMLHRDDRQQPGLWMADAAAWALQRAVAHDDPRWWARITDTATIIDAHTGRELTVTSNRAAPPQPTSGERGPEHLSQSAQASLLSRPSYPQSRSPANQPTAPIHPLAGLLRQIEAAATHHSQQQMLRSIRGLNRVITAVADAVDASTQSPASRSAPASQTPDSEPEASAPAVDTELTIE